MYLGHNVPRMQEEQKQVHLRVDRDLYTKLKVRCAYASVSMQDYILGLIRENMGESPRKGGSLLIVEDEAILRDSLRDVLRENYDVSAVATAEQGLDLLRSRDYDAVVTDVRLPGKSGIDLVRELKETKPYIKSVVITAYPSVELAVEAMKQGASDYLTKPLKVDDLEALLGRIIARDPSYSLH